MYHVAGCASLDILLQPFFKEVDTLSKNVGSKRGKIHFANKCIATALIDMEKWIGQGNWKSGFGDMFLGFRDAMARYELRLSGQSSRQAELHTNPHPARTVDNALKVYIKEARRADKAIPRVLESLNEKLQESAVYEKIDLTDLVKDMPIRKRHEYLLKVQEGLSVPFFSYTWSRGGSRGGVCPHVIWRLPPQSDSKGREEGMSKSQANIDFLNKNTSIYHSRAERSAYLATVLNTNFVNGTAAAQAIFEFITGGVMSNNFVSPDAIAAARFALNCQDPDIIVDLRRLNARPKNVLFDPFWAKMAKVVQDGLMIVGQQPNSNAMPSDGGNPFIKAYLASIQQARELINGQWSGCTWDSTNLSIKEPVSTDKL